MAIGAAFVARLGLAKTDLTCYNTAMPALDLKATHKPGPTFE
jgi:hypothetical protein